MTSGEIIGSAIQLLIGIGSGAVILQLLTLRQSRRKITGEASVSEANAATQLANAAMSIVDAERKDKQALRDELIRVRSEKEEAERMVAQERRLRERLAREMASANIPLPQDINWN